MNKKLSISLLLLLSTLSIVSCGQTSSSTTNPEGSSFNSSVSSSSSKTLEEDHVNVTFDFNYEDVEPIVVKVNKKDTVQTAYSYNETGLEQRIENSTKHPNLEFVEFFYSKDAANDPENEDNFQYVFTDGDIITQDITVYAGYKELTSLTEFNSFISTYLGVFQKDSYSPIPFLETDEGISFVEDDFNQNHYISILGVTSSQFDEYKNKLSLEYSFVKQEENVYVDKYGAYTLRLTYTDSTSSLRLDYEFNDDENAFPTYFFASTFFAYKTQDYINDRTFSLAENVLEEGQTKFLTRSLNNSESGDGSYTKHIYYRPKEDDSDPVGSLYDYLDNIGVVTVNTSEDSDGNTIYNYAIDGTYSTMVKASLLSNVTSQEAEFGLEVGMIDIAIDEMSTTSLPMDEMSTYYKRLMGVDYPSDLYGNLDAKAYSSLLYGTLSSGQYIVRYYASSFDKYDLERYLQHLNTNGFFGSKTESTSYTTYAYTSKEGNYVINLNYYPKESSTILYEDRLIVTLYYQSGVFDKLGDWFKACNKGGGTITSIPKPNGEGKYSTGYLTSGSSYVYYTHYLTVGDATKDDLEDFKEALLEEGNFTKDEALSQEYGIDYFVSNDGYYFLNCSLEDDGTLYIQIYYDGSSTATGVDQVYSAIKGRLGTGNDFTIPSLETFIGTKQVDISQYYASSSNRAFITIPVTTETEATSLVTSIYEALEADTTNYTYAGTNSGGTIKFYIDNKYSVYIYAFDSSEDTTYSVTIGLYVTLS